MSKLLWLVRLVDRKPSPRSIPIAGDDEKIQQRDYFSLELTNKATGESFLFDKLEGRSVSARAWVGRGQGGSYETRTEIPLDSLDAYLPVVRFYYGTRQYLFDKTWELRIFHALQMHRVVDVVDRWRQAIYNRRSLALVDRIELMNYIGERYMQDPNFHVSAWSRVVDRYGKRVVRHPEIRAIVRREKVLLDSLVITGELTNRPAGGLQVSPMLFAALDRLRIEERRHSQALTVQVIVVMVAVATLIAAGVQAWAAYAGLHDEKAPQAAPAVQPAEYRS